MDADILEAEQKRVDEDATSYYVGTLVVPLDVRGTGISQNILQGAYVDFKRRNKENGQSSVCFFDCAQANYPWLAEFVKKSADPSPADNFDGVTIDLEEIGQYYWVKVAPEGEESTIVKMRELPADQSDIQVLDTQHTYAYHLVD